MAPIDLLEEAAAAHKCGNLRAAEDHYRKILRSSGPDGRVWFGLGKVCADGGRLAEAAACLRQAIEFLPSDFLPHLHLGNVLLKLEHYKEAEEIYRRCLELKPDNIDALVNRGFALGELDRLDEARQSYERARALDPKVPEIHHNLGNVLRDKELFEEALASYNEALRLRPNYAKALVNKGIALVARGRIVEAEQCAKRSVELLPSFAEAHNCLAHILSVEGRIDEALKEFEHAIELKPNYSDAFWNRALLWLIQGDYERGWPGYEWRWSGKRATKLPKFTKPRWDGSPLDGRNLLLHAEQGLGDTLHFVRYAPLIRATGGRVIVQCQSRLIPLLSRTAGIDQLVPWGEPSPAHDVWLPFMSAPMVMNTTLSTVPATIPYLEPDPDRVEHWRWQLSALAGLRVGIAWQGSPRHPWDRHRSTTLSAFEPLARIPGIQLVCLQKKSPEEANQPSDLPFKLIELNEFADRAGAFTDTAAIIKNLDLVVTVDTSIAHLAGGLGAPVWLALHRTPDWRWLLDRDNSPWYPTARLFRQKKFGDWTPVFAQIAEELAKLAESRRRDSPLLVEVSAGELLDKLTILQIKSERIQDSEKLANVHRELQALGRVRTTLSWTPKLDELFQELRTVNESLWQIENAIREHEQRQDFGSEFIELARAVYRTNDRRGELKRRINEVLHSRFMEVKEYSGAGPSQETRD